MAVFAYYIASIIKQYFLKSQFSLKNPQIPFSWLLFQNPNFKQSEIPNSNCRNPNLPFTPKTRPGYMENCSAMHLCWTIGPLHRQILILAGATAQQIWDLQPGLFLTHTKNHLSSVLHIASAQMPSLRQATVDVGRQKLKPAYPYWRITFWGEVFRGRCLCS